MSPSRSLGLDQVSTPRTLGVFDLYFRRFDFFGVLLPLCSVSFFESVFDGVIGLRALLRPACRSGGGVRFHDPRPRMRGAVPPS